MLSDPFMKCALPEKLCQSLKRSSEMISKKSEKQHEIDFVVNDGSKRVYIQSAINIEDDGKRRQEILPLLRSGDFFKRIVITAGSARPHMDDDGILYAGVIPFLLDGDSLNW